jgi:long-chain fatty acid transport protein
MIEQGHKKMMNIKNMIKKIILIFVIIFFLWDVSKVFAGLSSADYNYNNDLIGDRATGFAGAFTAISDDPSGAYYNPAGLSFAAENQISLSVNTYKSKKVVYEKAIGGNKSYDQNLESFYPSFFGVVQSLGEIKIAFTFLNINNEILDQDNYYKNIDLPQPNGAVPKVDFNINYNNTDNTMMAGLSTSMLITKSFTIGLTVYGLRRRQEQISNQIIHVKEYPDLPDTAADESVVMKNTYVHQSNYITDVAWGIAPRLGFQFMPSDYFSLGLSVGRGIILYHQRSTQSFDDSSLARITGDTLDRNKDEITKNSDLPYNVRTGIAWFPSNKLVISGDIIADLGDKNYSSDVENTINFALGLEYYLTNAIPVRTGFFTNFANTPPLEGKAPVGSDNRDMHADLFGISLSLSWQSRNSSITLGGFYQFGSGKAEIVELNQIQDVKIGMFQVALTGSAKY